jgi:SAM-dependent methyltransferase
MHPELYAQIFSVQTTHWWGRSRRELALDLLKRFGASEYCRHIDVGCGTGQNLQLLDGLEPSLVVGIDVSPIALELAGKVSGQSRLVQSNINGILPFADEAFDVATIFNVLCHRWVESEVAVLREVRRILRRNGLLLITEPALPMLARKLDIVGMARCRYRLQPFIDLLGAANFDVLFTSYITSFGVPIILGTKVVAALARKTPADDAQVPDMRPLSPGLNATLYRLARIEAGLVKASVPMPFGTTIICIARRH